MPRLGPEISCAERPPVPDTQHTRGPWRVGNLQAPTCHVLVWVWLVQSWHLLLPRVDSRSTLSHFPPAHPASGVPHGPLLPSQAKLFFSGSWPEDPLLNLDLTALPLREVFCLYVDGDLLLFHYSHYFLLTATISLAISLGIWEKGKLTCKGSYYHIELEYIFNFHNIWLACDWFSFPQSRKKGGFSSSEDMRCIRVK